MDPDPSSAERASFDEEAVRFAQEHLGPRSSSWLKSSTGRQVLRTGRLPGDSVEDGVLRAVHSYLGEEPGLEEEFLGFFLQRLLQVRLVDVYPGLRRFLDTGDLVQSVLGDLWPQLREIEFRDRASFLALLVTRLRWKATSRRRDLHAAKRREDRRATGLSPDEFPAQPTSQLEGQVSKEEAERTVEALFRLPPMDRTAVRLHLEGASSEEIAQEIGVSVSAARKRLERALRRLRLQLGGSA